MTKTKREVAMAAVEGYLRGENPSEAELAAAPVLDMWSVHIAKVSERDSHPKMFLKGDVVGHPTLGSDAIETTAIVWLDRSMTWCRSMSRVYRLDGKVIDDEGMLA